MFTGRQFMIYTTTSLLLFLLWSQQGRSDFISDEHNLRSDLLNNYSTKVRPAYKTNITVSSVLSSLNHLDIATQSMSVNLILFVAWYDSRLAWNVTSYGGVDTLVTAPEDIWTPPIVIENAVEHVGVIGGKDRDATPVRIDSYGVVLWSPPSEVTTSCEMLIAQYPFDTQVCTVVLIGWTYPLSEMNIAVGNIDTFTLYAANGEFDLIKTRSYFTDIGTPSDESNTYRKLHFEFTFRRKWQFYGQNLLMPIVLNSILMNAVFALPIDSGEKMSYSLTVLLSYVVFLTWVTENLPPVSTDTSILQVYLAVVLCMGCLATLLTTWVLNLYHKPSDQPVTPFYHALVARGLVPLRKFCTRSKKKKKKNEHDDNKMDPVPHSKTKVVSLQPRPESALASRKKFMDFSASLRNGADDVTGSDAGGRERTVVTFTWQEVAVQLDHLFLWVFAVNLIIVTTVIFALLYAKY